MSLHQAAWDAYMTAQADDIDAARQLLTAVLGPYDPEGLGEPVYVDVTPARTQMVFDADSFRLMTVVRAAGADEVRLVSFENGEWTTLAEVTSLAQLGSLVGPPPDPEDEFPVWWQRHSPDGFDLGDKAWWPDRDGTLHEVVAVGGDGKNVWRPDEYGWAPVGG